MRRDTAQHDTMQPNAALNGARRSNAAQCDSVVASTHPDVVLIVHAGRPRINVDLACRRQVAVAVVQPELEHALGRACRHDVAHPEIKKNAQRKIRSL